MALIVDREELERRAREMALNYCYGGMYDSDFDCFAMCADSDQDYINAYNDILESLLAENEEFEDSDDVWIK